MDELERTLTAWIAACDPDRRPSDDGWYVALDAWNDPEHVRPMQLRGPSASRGLLNAIQRFGQQGAHLLAGFRGVGKTTELDRLEALLGTSANASVIRVRARDYHHLSDALAVEELVLVLGAGIGEAAAETLGVEALKRKPVWTRIQELLTTELSLDQWSWKLGPVELKGHFRQGTDFRRRLRELAGSRPDALSAFLHGIVREVVAGIGPRKLVILVDDLEKFDAPVDRIGRIYAAMADLFFHEFEVLHLPDCHVVYTVPPFLGFVNRGIGTRYSGRTHPLPAVKVQERPPDRAPFTPGLRALASILEARVDLDALFGGEREPCVSALAAASGGHIRDLLHLVQQVLLLAEELPVSSELVAQAIQQLENDRGPLFGDTVELLEAVRTRGSLDGLESGQVGAIAHAMDQHLQLCFYNGQPWYDVHPLVRGHLDQAPARGEV